MSVESSVQTRSGTRNSMSEQSCPLDWRVQRARGTLARRLRAAGADVYAAAGGATSRGAADEVGVHHLSVT